MAELSPMRFIRDTTVSTCGFVYLYVTTICYEPMLACLIGDDRFQVRLSF